ncbi:inorganic pyrophosphatase [Edaphobacter aggregans]|jgi:inorganic pyrophosphatase|uniref:inorganic diphosphatase n=1 Tax=Edaphobacter aggregans TaxID=570835 RepID=A0A3R9QE15_9BACT|nr:inorganic diphosphatase [Edaphobacter aggregans]RSL19083.1 inorganic pyrophosphatase [Edaphobacter aggregans]
MHQNNSRRVSRRDEGEPAHEVACESHSAKAIQDDDLIQVIIETPAQSRNKFAFDPKQSIFALKKVLPAGMVFPYDFGFLPQTIAPDGDPIDVLLLMDKPAFPGVAVKSRLIGVIEGEQLDGKKKIRNDRLVAVAEANHMYAGIRRLSDLPANGSRSFRSSLSTITIWKASNTDCSDVEGRSRQCDSSKRRRTQHRFRNERNLFQVFD